MSKPISQSNLARSSPLVTVRRENVNIDPLEAATGGPTIPQPPRPMGSPKPATSEAAPFQRLLLPSEILDIETQNFMGLCKKQPLREDSVTQDITGLQKLAKEFYWQSVAKLSEKLLSEQGKIPEHLVSRVSGLRFEALYRMKLYDDLANEVSSLLVDEERKFKSNPDPKNFNYNVIVSTRLLLNDIKLMTGRSEEAVEQLNSMKTWLLNVEPSNIVLFWLWQVKSHLVNGFIRLRNWKGASLELNGMLNELQGRIQTCNHMEDRTNLLKGQIILLTRLARLLFQIGSVKKGILYYEKACSIVSLETTVAEDAVVQSQLLLTQGLLLFSTEQFEQALDNFATVIDTESTVCSQDPVPVLNLSQLQVSDGINSCSHDGAIAAALSLYGLACGAPEDGNIAVAVNNLAICSLYVKQIRQAIARLEQLILGDPARFLIDPVVFNLCTLYDLSFAPETSATKKKLMQRVASEYHMDDPILHWKSFRLS